MVARNQGDKVGRDTALAGVFELSLAGRAQAIRGALTTCRAHLSTICSNPQKLDDIELVIAETLNNIVEHALAERQDDAPIQISCTQDGDLISLVFKDSGIPFANHTPPGPKQVGTIAHAKSLPEGGFGWGLIHHLARDISYVRVNQHNVLTIVFDGVASITDNAQKPS